LEVNATGGVPTLRSFAKGGSPLSIPLGISTHLSLFQLHR
jgi:hypothetical protein